MTRILTTFLFFTFQQYVTAQNETFEWNDETCTYLSEFDSSLYTKEQIKNCYEIAYFGDFTITKTPSIFKLSDIEKLNEDDLRNEYLTKKERLKNLSFPKKGNWKYFRDSLLNELDQDYKLSSIAYKAYKSKNYRILNSFWTTDNCLEQYSKGLQGNNDELLDTWYKLNSKKAEINCCPKEVWNKYEKMRNSKNWKELAQIDIMTFGWWNCAVKNIKKFDNWRHYNEFEKLFISTKEIDCDEI